ncbi:MAG TPA: metalloregulator ArsR/SmtB family transcription factor [Steroidobacteraceae bacterium]|nr:metalloregulator ArsR/SmtB family transcription factor [Steroidobacteraceae bacterium]
MSPRRPEAAAARQRAAGLPAPVQASQALASVFAALGDPTRLRLVAVLCAGGACSIAQLTANTAITRQAVTKHLNVLADAGVVRDTKAGRERLWQLDPEQLEQAKRTLEIIGRQWQTTLGKLKAFAEST